MTLLEQVRRHDPDRFLTALFAPADKRDALFTLYAFNHELARAREVVSEPPLALIRLQWWREVVEGARRRHDIAEPLRALLDAGALRGEDMLAMIDAREIEAAPEIASIEDWRHYVSGSAGSVAVAAAHLLEAPDPEALRPLGAAYGVAGLLRSVGAHARQGRCLLPTDMIVRHGLSAERIIADPMVARPVLMELAHEGLAMLRSAPMSRRAIAAALPAVLARRDLRRAPSVNRPRGFADQFAIVIAAFLGRV